MSEHHVTQCPHCRTSFRASQAQLAAAHGVVRCGACLHVFNAAEQLFGAAASTGHTATAPASRLRPGSNPPPPATKPASDDTLWIHDDLDLDNLNLDEELARLEEQEQQLSQQFLALESTPRQTERFADLADTEESSHDESWAEALLREESQKHGTPTAQTALAEPPMRDEPDELPEPRLGTLPDEPEDDERLTPGLSIEPLADTALVSDRQLLELNDEPLQLDWRQPSPRPWGRWLSWGLLNLIAASGLLVQYVLYNFDELARQDRYRPWFEQICPSLGCELPSKVDIDQIRSSNLVVRSHPEFSGALIVDAILYNRAPFAQPFPLLEIRFADLGGQLVASRRFKPSEYLAGELAGKAEMPPQTPIHISLDILDPGSRAVNYSLSFHSPE
ncbi:DUF3426 domain-containing protein [Pseudomonas sp. NCCP-436]|uniref:DUF3426 domain-containing protein n=1 Tax=Pseudomonas sp. NCCP-436 TaxID=2842481 RepID=UPI001C80354B|nr:DUF3426 domain-containing protein [Pseudomonas sp. NCCP-436]GIZ12977.1 hypothetical protein NCCP436_23930 [Pseudomonas sp. NCCP-436]